ncbi:hypothetical protein NDU88_003044, partial [Pleurodeles waltl]
INFLMSLVPSHRLFNWRSVPGKQTLPFRRTSSQDGLRELFVSWATRTVLSLQKD